MGVASCTPHSPVINRKSVIHVTATEGRGQRWVWPGKVSSRAWSQGQCPTGGGGRAWSEQSRRGAAHLVLHLEAEVTGAYRPRVMSEAQATTQWEELQETATASGVPTCFAGAGPAVSHTQALPMTCQSRSSPTPDLSVPPTSLLTKLLVTITSPAHDLSLSQAPPPHVTHTEAPPP